MRRGHLATSTTEGESRDLMLKRIAAIALTAALAVGLLTSCVGSSTPPAGSTTITTTAPKTGSLTTLLGIHPGFVMRHHFPCLSPISLSPVRTAPVPPPLTQPALTRLILK